MPRAPAVNSPHRGNGWPEPFPGASANGQEMTQVEPDVPGLIGVMLKGFPPKVNWSQVELCAQKEERPQISMKGVTQTFQRHTASNSDAPEHVCFSWKSP